jgi:hypothetical protein
MPIASTSDHGRRRRAITWPTPLGPHASPPTTSTQTVLRTPSGDSRGLHQCATSILPGGLSGNRGIRPSSVRHVAGARTTIAGVIELALPIPESRGWTMWIRVVCSQSAHTDGAHARDEAYRRALEPAIGSACCPLRESWRALTGIDLRGLVECPFSLRIRVLAAPLRCNGDSADVSGRESFGSILAAGCPRGPISFVGRVSAGTARANQKEHS